MLTDETFTAAVAAVDAALKREMFATAPDQGPRREALYFEARALARVLKRLHDMVSDGEMIAAEMERTGD